MAGFDPDGALSKFKAWAARPFREDMDWLSWVLFFVFALSVAFLWTRILGGITEIGVED